ncbi:uncharacterized protein LOC130641654 isoform X2 [Hydractinia symbiolongicarpus]|uniref:uncharacterized protein LOC130641654 isoform X2 n=1 Tax=Hydractinia symbiolongicarpus TaxID=13093 RepID=UPI00254E9F2F|nr:uncharacterized protein LOC130641654 isoform X2 [Hydractinia symbiolongicarpus]
MEEQANLFKDDTLKGISLSIKNLQHQETEVKSSNPDAVHSITKYNPHFRNLINFLDLAFSFGLKDQRKGYWPFIKKIAHSSVVEMIEKHKYASNEIKKGYIWLFLTFIEDSLDSYLKMMTMETKMIKYFYQRYSLLRDTERCEILFNLLVGMEDDPYMDYGHDPVLRQEKIIIRVQALSHNSHEVHNTQTQFPSQPDVTIFSDGGKAAKYPDLVSNKKNFQTSVSISEDGADIVHHRKHKSTKKKKRRTVSAGDEFKNNESDDLTISVEMEDDNFIPEIIGSPGYTVCLPEAPSEILKTSDPMLKSFSEQDANYTAFLNGYVQDEDVKENNEEKTKPEEFEASNEDVETKLDRLSLQESEGYKFTYVSDDEKDEEDYGIYRADSFDRFCRRGSPDLGSITDEQGVLAEADNASSPVGVAPKITRENLTHSPISSSISRSSIDKLNDARLDTKSGILLPALPRRPNYKEATELMCNVTLDQSAKVLISLEVFENPTESLVQMFIVSIGHFAGLNYTMNLLISNLTIYLLKTRDTVNSGFINMLSINFDSVNKVQIGLNYQDIFIFHDHGCLHVSTGDEIVTRSIVSTIKSIIKSNQDVKDGKHEIMAANTNNELDLVIQDWIICNTGVEEPEVKHFSLIKYSLLSSPKGKEKVMKAGHVHFRHSLLGVMSRWEVGFFALRGYILNHYSTKRNDLKHSYNLSVKCGGCIRAGSDEGLYIFKIIGNDGATPFLELAVENENDANDWLMTICQVVADAKNGPEQKAEPGALINCGLVSTHDKLFLFNQDPKSGRLLMEDSCSIQDVTQVCVDNQVRTHCTLFIDDHMDEESNSNKTVWLFLFPSEYELGKFEQKLYACWQSLYQVPLQFVLLSDQELKETIKSVLNYQNKDQPDIGRQLLLELTSN